MAFSKREYKDEETLITAKNLNDIQDAILELEGGLFTINNEASGETITITDADKRGLKSLIIYGKTTQDGAPTPKAPVALVNVGNGGNVTVNVAGENKDQSMIIATPNGLPGIPVTSGGNYTDANGQQWICDEIDFFRGVYVQRVGRAVFDGSSDESWAMYTNVANQFHIPVANCYHSNSAKSVYTTHFEADIIGSRANKYEISYSYSNGVAVNTALATDVSGWKAWLTANPITVHYRLVDSIETPLPEELLTAYSALRTYKEHTTVSTDAGAYMELEYVMDAKKYIDSLLKANGWIANISLPASAWKGTKSPWYQVVQIPGVTENSQVDLTPDVSQLAIFHDKDLAFVAENEDGVVTVYAVGQKPTNDYVIQATIKEVL